MDPFTALMLVYGAYNAYNTLTADTPERPSLPNYIRPDATLLNEFGGYADWQNKTRSKLLAEYYGGKAVNRGMDTRIGADSEVTPVDTLLPGENSFYSLTAVEPGSNPLMFDVNEKMEPFYGGGMPTKRWETDMTYQRPANKFANTQRGIVSRAQSDFTPEMEKYFAERGIAPGGAVEGAAKELGKDFKQRQLDINSRAHDIYAQTMASVGFSEFGQAGPQAAMLAANVGNASNVFNNSMAQSYQQALQQWQYNLQGGQENQFGQAFGQILPLLYQLYGGGGTPSPYYGSAHAYQPGNTSMGWLG